MMENVEKCLSQLTDLLIAAGKCQPGQVPHKVRMARSELDGLGYTRDRNAATGDDTLYLGVHIPSFTSIPAEYRIHRNVCEYNHNMGGWEKSCTYYGGGECAEILREWVAKRIAEITAINGPEPATERDADQHRYRELRAKIAGLLSEFTL